MCTPWEFLGSVSKSLKDSISLPESSVICVSDESDENDHEEPLLQSENPSLFVICLNTRDATWLFMPCKHAICCTLCANTIMETVKSCPTCRSQITEKIQIYLN